MLIPMKTKSVYYISTKLISLHSQLHAQKPVVVELTSTRKKCVFKSFLNRRNGERGDGGGEPCQPYCLPTHRPQLSFTDHTDCGPPTAIAASRKSINFSAEINVHGQVWWIEVRGTKLIRKRWRKQKRLDVVRLDTCRLSIYKWVNPGAYVAIQQLQLSMGLPRHYCLRHANRFLICFPLLVTTFSLFNLRFASGGRIRAKHNVITDRDRFVHILRALYSGGWEIMKNGRSRIRGRFFNCTKTKSADLKCLSTEKGDLIWSNASCLVYTCTTTHWKKH